MKFIFSQKWKLTLKVIPFVIVVLILKFIAHYLGWEFLSLSPLFTALISANVFLIGFLITGVLADYKEGEKLPIELTASLETLADESIIIYKSKKAQIAKECLSFTQNLTSSIISWFHKKEKTTDVLEQIGKLSDYFLAFEPLTQANFIVRLKQEQNNIRKIILRIHSIRETSFNGGYMLGNLDDKAQAEDESANGDEHLCRPEWHGQGHRRNLMHGEGAIGRLAAPNTNHRHDSQR